MEKFVKDIKNLMSYKIAAAEPGFSGVTVRDYMEETDLLPNSLYISVASLKSEKLYESFDCISAAIAEIDFRSVTADTVLENRTVTAYQKNEKLIEIIKNSFSQQASAEWNPAVLRTDITAFDNAKPLQTNQDNLLSLIRVQFTFLMPYTALE